MDEPANQAPSGSDANIKRARFARARHRSRNHDQAHNGDQPQEDHHPAHPRHPDIPQGDAAVVTAPDAFDELLAHLRDANSFAYDSEFIGELTYIPKLCLIQVATTTRIALIDPLAGLDLAPFWELLTDPTVEKIVHAGEQDVEPVVRHLGREAQNVFDTQIAAGFIGMAYPVALLKLVHEVIGIKLGKGLTFTHWDQRPLSPSQLRYAADDVRYLPTLREKIGEKLNALGHTAWARQEFDAMCDARLFQFNPESHYQRVRGAQTLSGHGLAILKELTIWRDAQARAHDVPARAFLKDEILVDLSRNPIKDIARLARVRGLPRPVEAAHGAEIVAATVRGLSTPAGRMPAPRPEPSPTERFRADALWAAAQCLCIGQHLDPALVTSRQEIADFQRLLDKNTDTTKLHINKGWRREALGDPLTQLLHGHRQITLQWADHSLLAR